MVPGLGCHCVATRATTREASQVRVQICGLGQKVMAAPRGHWGPHAWGGPVKLEGLLTAPVLMQKKKQTVDY